MSKSKHQWQQEDRDKLLTYNTLDSCGTARVARTIVQDEHFKTERVQKLLWYHEQMSHIGAEMHSTGFQVYEEGRKALLKDLRTLSTRRANELLAHVGGSKRNPGFDKVNDNNMRAMLYKRHAKPGIQCYEVEEPEPWDDAMWTNEERDTLAVDREALMRIFINPAHEEEVRELVSLFWRAKAPGKAITTWVGPTNSKGEPSEVQQHIGEDGRMRADWNSAATETMRWASALMTLPEAKDDGQLGGRLPNIRNMYCATPGWMLKHWDWSQQEIRMYYAVYQDPALGAAIASGNVYIYDARQWFKPQLQQMFGAAWDTVNLKKEWKNGYRQTKVIHLGSQYLAGAAVIWVQGLMQDRTLKFHSVKVLNQAFHKTYAVSMAAAAEEHARVLRTGYSEGYLLGGRRYYPAPPPVTETCNYPIQRSAGEMGAIAMVGIWQDIKREGLPARILTNEHDAGTLEFLPERSVETALDDIIKKNTQGPWRIKGVDHMFPVDYHVGFTWAEACDDQSPKTASY